MASSESPAPAPSRHASARARRTSLPTATTVAALLWVVPVAFFGWFSVVDRWREGDAALHEVAPGASVVAGISAQGGIDGSDRQRSQVYLVFPASLRTLQAYSVTQTGSAQPHVKPIPLGLPIFCGLYSAWIGGSIWYVTRKRRETR